MRLIAPRKEHMGLVAGWRMLEDVRLGLRTGRMATLENQDAFYTNVICDLLSPHRYWSVVQEKTSEPLAFVGLTDLDWGAGHGEISLLVNPNAPGGTGALAVDLVLAEAFERMRLTHVFGECYDHNPAIGFWKNMLVRHQGSISEHMVKVPGRKFWNGKLHGSTFFWFTAEARL